MGAVTTRQRIVWSTQADIDKGRAFFERYRHAWCRDGYSGREGVLMDVQGKQVHLRLRSGTEFTCDVRDLVILRLSPPILYRQVRYVGGGDVTARPEGTLIELCAVDGGMLATVQPADGPAWFALLSDLERVGCLLGAVAGWADPPFVLDGGDETA
ncbi:hypothetical protein [Embleya sp. AB8]|uniref:hypothetical protein n=1 Tax=Embleya sp. AB8 TaxID=3156304 RepID=UPI003C718913